MFNFTLLNNLKTIMRMETIKQDKIEAGEFKRINGGYHFTRNENDVLNKISLFDIGAANIFEHWIARIIRKDINWKLKDNEIFNRAMLKVKNLNPDLYNEMVLITEPGYLFSEEEHDVLIRIINLNLGFNSTLSIWVRDRLLNSKFFVENQNDQIKMLQEIESIKDLDIDLYNDINRLGFGICLP